MAGLKDFLIVMLVLVGMVGGLEGEEDNLAMESMRGSVDDDYDFAAFLAKAGEVLGDPGGDWGNRVEKASPSRERITQSRTPNSRGSQSRKVNQYEGVGRTRGGASQFQTDPLANVTRPTPDLLENLLTTAAAAGSQSVGEMQEELQHLLFGGQQQQQHQQQQQDRQDNVTMLPRESLIDGDRVDFIDYDPEDYDLYSYESSFLMGPNGEDPPTADLLQAESRQRRPLRRRRLGHRGRPQLGSATNHIPRRHSLPPIRAPEVHKVPGRVQGLPARVGNRDQFQSSADCDFYTAELCLGVRNYPRSQIVQLLGANRRISHDMIAEVEQQSADDLIDGVSSNQESTYTFSHYYGSNSNRREDPGLGPETRDFAQDGGFLCPSEIKYAKPKRGKTAQGTWKDIVNVADYTQTLRMEKCLKPGGSCSYVSHHYKSQCSQVYNYHRLLSWDEERGLHMDIYKVPTCCSCHIMGYSYVYPPLSKNPDSHSGSSSAPQSNQPSLAVSRPPPPQPQPAPPSQPRPPRQPTRPSPPVGSFVDFGNPRPRPNLEQPSFGGPNRPNLEQPSFGGPSRPLAPQRPQRPPASAPDLDNFIPDFNPQEELEAFMETIGNDNFQDFGNFGGKTNNNGGSSSLNRNLQRPGGRPSSGGRRVRRPGSGFNQQASAPRRRGDGFGPGGKPGGVERQPMGDRSKYESIPLDTNNLVRKQLDVKKDEEKNERRQPTVSKTGESVNYGYHPIIDFFRPYRNS